MGDSAYTSVIGEIDGYLDDHRAGAVWSAKLQQQHNLWRLAASTAAGALVIALTYPTATITALLLKTLALFLSICVTLGHAGGLPDYPR